MATTSSPATARVLLDLNLSERLDLPALKKRAAEKEKNDFIEVFLMNKLCYKIQRAIREEEKEQALAAVDALTGQ